MFPITIVLVLLGAFAKSLAIISGFLLLAGLIRLFIFGSRYSYGKSLTDISVLRKGDIILTGKRGVLASWYIQLGNVLTRKLRHRFWTHAAIYQGNGKLWEAQPKPLGVIERDIKDYIDGGSYVRAFRHRYIKDEKILNQAIEWCASKKGEGYDLKGTVFYALSILTPIGFNFIFDTSWAARFFSVKDKYFCSELIVDAFDAIGYSVSPYDGWRVKPSDFIGNPVLEEVV